MNHLDVRAPLPPSPRCSGDHEAGAKPSPLLCKPSLSCFELSQFHISKFLTSRLKELVTEWFNGSFVKHFKMYTGLLALVQLLLFDSSEIGLRKQIPWGQ